MSSYQVRGSPPSCPHLSNPSIPSMSSRPTETSRTTVRSRRYPGERPWPVNFVEVRQSVPDLRTSISNCLSPLFDDLSTGRKLKCDGRPTCANCQRRSIPCVYVPVYVCPWSRQVRFAGVPPLIHGSFLCSHKQYSAEIATFVPRSPSSPIAVCQAFSGPTLELLVITAFCV